MLPSVPARHARHGPRDVRTRRRQSKHPCGINTYTGVIVCLTQTKEKTMGRALKYAFLAGVAIFVSYHYWPHETVHAGVKVKDTTIAAARAGYETAKK